MSGWQRPSVQRSIALLVVFYFSVAQLAILPAAFESSAADPAEAASPFSVTHLVDWLQRQEAEANWSTAASAPATPVGVEGVATADQVAAAATQALAEWQAAEPDADLTGVTVGIADLPDLALGQITGTSVLIDVDAAGHGWDAMDLLTVVRHELGHMLGHAHTDGLMSPTLAPGETHTVPAAESTTTETTSNATSTTDTSTTDTSTTDTSSTETSTTDTTTTDTSTTDTSSTDSTSTDTTTADATTDGPSTSGWTVDGDTATYTATGELAHSLVHLEATGQLAVVGPTGDADVVDLAGISAVALFGSDGDDALTVTGAMPVAVTVDLGAGTDELVGPSTDQVWDVTGAGAGSVTGISFTGIEHVTGGVDNEDEFVIHATGGILGVVAGGDGGYDTIRISDGPFTTVRYEVTGPDSGVITRDADVLVYRGMEPVNAGSATEQAYVGTVDGETITIADDATADDDVIEVRFTGPTGYASGETHVVNLTGVTKLVFDGAGGDDVIHFAYIAAAMKNIQIVVRGGEGNDRLMVLDTAGTWTLDAINGGTWEATDAAVAFDGTTVAFEAIENLTSAATKAETFDFRGAGALTGEITDAGGTVTVLIADFGEVSGDFRFGRQANYIGTDTASTPVAVSANALTLGGSAGTVWFGVRNPIQDVGVSGITADFALAVLTDGIDVWHAWVGSFSGAALTGLSDLGFTASSFTIAVNTPSLISGASARPAINFGGANALTVGTVDIDLATAGVAVSTEHAMLSIGNFVRIAGSFAFVQGGTRFVDVGISGVTDTTQASDLQTAADNASVTFDGSTFTGVEVTTTLIGIGNATVFAGYAPTGFPMPTTGVAFTCDLLADAYGICADGINVGMVLSSLANPELLSGFTLPSFMGIQVDIATVALLGIPANLFHLGFVGLEFTRNRGGEVATGSGPIVGSNAWVRWGASLPNADPLLAGLAIPTGSGTQYLDADDPILRVGAEEVKLSIGEFLLIRGSFLLEQGGAKLVDIATAGLDAEAGFGEAVTGPETALTGRTWENGVIGGVEVTTTLIGIGNATVFAGYRPLGLPTFTAARPDTDGGYCDLFTEAYGVCVDEVTVGLVLASLTDASLITGYTLPGFTAARIDIAGDVELLGLDQQTVVRATLSGVAFVLNSDDAIKKGTTTLVGSSAWVVWTSIDNGAGCGNATAAASLGLASGDSCRGLLVNAGSDNYQLIDMASPIVGVSADVIALTISTFISIRGGFAFTKGSLINLVIDAPTLTEGQLATLANGITVTDVRDGGVTVANVATSTLGISNASVYVGYASAGYDSMGVPPTGTFYGVSGTGINLGMIWANVARSRLSGGITLPSFFGMAGSMGSAGFSGIPPSIFTLKVTGATMAYNGAGTLGGFTGLSPPAHANWNASTTSGTNAAITVPTNSSGATVTIDHEDAIIGIAATQVILGIGDFIRVSGSFSFQQGADEKVTLGTSGLTLAEYNSLTLTKASSVTVDGTINATAGTVSNVTIQNLAVTTTLFGVSNAAVFVGYNPSGFTADAIVDCAALKTAAKAFGFCLDGISLGLVLANVLPDQLGAFTVGRLVALRASLASFSLANNLLGVGDFSDAFSLAFEGLELTVNKTAAIGALGTAWIDWAASFSAGFAVPTGSAVAGKESVLIDFDSAVLGVSADRVTISIGAFVYISGSFAYETGGIETLDVDVRPVTGTATKVLDVQFKTTTFGIANASIFVGHAPGGFNLETALGTGNNLLEKADLGPDATGLLLQDIDLGMVFLTQVLPAGTTTFSTMWALKANVAGAEFVNLLPDFLTIELRHIGLVFNGRGTAAGTAIGSATVDWEGSYAAGFAIPTSTTNADPVVIDVRGPVIGVSAGVVILSISDFVHISGGFSFTKGETLTVNVNTNIGSLETAPFTPITTVPHATNLYRSVDYSTLYNVQVETIQLGINDASVFLGYNPTASGTFDLGLDDDTTAVDESRILSIGELSTDAIGLFASDVDFGMVLSTIIRTGALTTLNFPTLPRFTTLKGSIGEFSVVGLNPPDDPDPFFTMYLRRGRVEVNIGGKWTAASTAAVGGAIDWTTQTYDDDNKDDTAEVAGGYGIATGGTNPDVIVKMNNYLVGGGVDLLVLGIGGFVHLRGAAYFEMGAIVTVPLVGIVEDDVFTSLFGTLPETVQTAIGLDSKQLRFLTFGMQDIYAFFGLGGPHWVTEGGVVTNDIKFECDPTQTSSGCVAAQCQVDLIITDGVADADKDTECRAVRNPDAVGIAVSDLDMVFAMGTPVLQADPTRYYTLRASADQAGLVGLEAEGLTAELIGVQFEVNISTPTVSGFPLLPVIDWKQYALTNGCSTADVSTIAAGTAPSGNCKPFGVRTGQVDADTKEDVREYFVYDGLFIRAAVRLAQIDVFGVLVARGSLAFVIGPKADVFLVDGTEVTGVLTMTIGGANLFGFVGVNGPHWTTDSVTKAVNYTIDGTTGGTTCTPTAVDGDSTCKLVRNSDAIGLALTDLDFGLFVGVKPDVTNPAVFVAADINVANFELVGIPGLTANAILALALNLGFALGGTGLVPSAINFKTSFSFDEEFDENGNGTSGEAGQQGYLLDTGDAANPMVIDFATTFIQVQLMGSIEIRAGPAADAAVLVRIDGIFFMAIDLDATSPDFRLLALGEMTIGPDIPASISDPVSNPLLSIGALGVLILNKDGIAGDFTVNLAIGGTTLSSVLSVAVYARVVFNTAKKDMTLRLPGELVTYLNDLGTQSVQGLAKPGDLADALLARLETCGGDAATGPKRCYTIDGRAPSLLTTGNAADTDARLVPDEGTLKWLRGTGLKSGATFEVDGSAYVVALLDGKLTLLSFATADVFGAIRISDDGQFELIADLDFQLGSNPTVAISAKAGVIASITAEGFYLDAYTVIQGNLLSVFDLNVRGDLEIDTRAGANYFRLNLSGSVNVLKVISLSGTLTVVVGGPIGQDAWFISVSLNARFGPLGLTASGFIASWGSFRLELSGYIDLTIAGTGIRGDVTAHASYCLRDGGEKSKVCLDDLSRYSGDMAQVPTHVLTEIRKMQASSGPSLAAGRTFLATLEGSVRVKFLGITLGSVSVGLEVTGALGDTVTVKARFSAKILFARVTVNVTIATFRLPGTLQNADQPPPILAQIEDVDGVDVLVLNVGDDARRRAVEKDEINEAYVIRREGDWVIVEAFGWSERFKSSEFTSISATFLGGNDELLIYDNVTQSVYAHMGDGNDRVQATGSGVAELHGGNDDDVLIGGSAADTLYGGAGNDFLDGAGGTDVVLDGGIGDDIFFGIGAQMAGETLLPGAGYDSLEVIGDVAGETIRLAKNPDGTKLELRYGSPTSPTTPLDITGIEELQLGLWGGDHLTIDGAVDGPGFLQKITVVFSDDTPEILVTQEDINLGVAASGALAGSVLYPAVNSRDRVTIRTSTGDDVVVVSGALSSSPTTFAQGQGISSIGPELADNGVVIPAPDVPTTTVTWLGHVAINLANSLVGATGGDWLVIDTLTGNDAVAVKGIEVDTTVDLDDGADRAYLGSTATCSAAGVCSSGGNSAGMNAPLNIIGGVGTDSLELDDSSAEGAATIVVTSTTIDGLSLHPDGIDYAGVDTLNIVLGDFNDTVRVQSTSATTRIEGGIGDDTFIVSSSAAPATTGSLDLLNGALTIVGGAGTNSATLSDRGDGGGGDTGTLTSSTLTDFSPAVITYEGMATLLLQLGAHADDLTITSVHAGTTTVDAGGGNDDVALHSAQSNATVTINGEGGNDWIEIQASAAALTINGNTGDDRIELGSTASGDTRTVSSNGTLDAITGAVTINGDDPSASDWLYLDDTGDTIGQTGTLTSSTITGLGLTGAVTYADIEHLRIALGATGTTFVVESTNGPGDTPAGSTDTILLLGGGDDTVTVSSTGLATTGTVNGIRGHLTIDGEGGVDRVYVSDADDMIANDGWLTATTLTGLGMGTTAGSAGVTYAGLELLTIALGTVSDTFNIRSTRPHTVVTTGTGADLVLVSSVANATGGALGLLNADGLLGGDVDGIGGFLDIDANGDLDRLVVDESGETGDDIGGVTSDEVSGLGATVDARNDAADTVHVITIRNVESGTFTITVGGKTTAALQFDAKQETVHGAIVTALSSLGIVATDVTVTRSPVLRADGITYRITLVGSFAPATALALRTMTVTPTFMGLPSTVASATVTTMSTGRIRYAGFEILEIFLGTGSDQLSLDSTGAVTTINGGAGDDVLDVETINDTTRVNGDAGNDTLTVNRQPLVLPDHSNAVKVNGIQAVLTIDGGNDSDTTEIQLSGTDTSRIVVLDSGLVGTNRLVAWGTADDDQFLLRRDLVALLNTKSGTAYTGAEYVIYDNGIDSLIVNMLAGNDHAALDDNSSITTVNGGAGADMFQVGQLFGDVCLDTSAGSEGPGTTTDVAKGCFNPEFAPPGLVDTTQGMLSNGISVVTTLNGGTGGDLFLVFSNKAVLNLNGEAGDDTFVIRTFLEEDSETTVESGDGADSISYLMNAPVNVNGGDGYDTLFIIGTEADDFFVITEDGVYGAGRFVSFVAIERLGIDAAEGNDHITVLATAPGLAVEVYGGLGSDTIDVAGDAPVVAADDLTGHSGLITHSIESGTWVSRPIDGVAAEIADDDEPAIVITQTGGDTVVYESGGTDSYIVRLTRKPTTDVRIVVLAAELTPDQLDNRERNVLLRTAGGEWLPAVELLFTPGNWNVAQTVEVKAEHDIAAERQQTTAIQHSVRGQLSGTVVSAASGTAAGDTTLTVLGTPFTVGTGLMDLTGAQVIITAGPGQGEVLTIKENTAGTLTLEGAWFTLPTGASTWQIRGIGEYDELVLNVVGVLMIDDDVDQVIIRPTGRNTIVGEDGTIDSWTVGLSRAPTATVTVTISGTADVCLSTSSLPSQTCTEGADLVLTFLAGDGAARTVYAIGRTDILVESFEYAPIIHRVGSADVDYRMDDGTTGGTDVVGIVTALVTDTGNGSTGIGDVLIVESDGATQVAEGIGIVDSYTVVLTSTPGDETVTVTAKAIPTRTQYDPGGTADRITRDLVQVLLSTDYDPITGIGTWYTSIGLAFTSANWSTARTVWVRAVDDGFIDGRILQAFPERAQRVHAIQGSLLVSGGNSSFGYPLAGFVPVMLPGEYNEPNTITPNAAFDVIEDLAVDRLVIHNEDSVSKDVLVLTGTTISGLGMGPGGITYGRPSLVPCLLDICLDAEDLLSSGIEELEILLGSGNDMVTITSTHKGTTTIRGGAGNDTFAVVSAVGHTRIEGDAGNDTVTVSDTGSVDPIDAQVLVSGGTGTDTVIVDDTADTVDDLATLTQTSLVGLDMGTTSPKAPTDLYSLELGIGVTSISITITATRPSVGTDPGRVLDKTFTVDVTALTADALAVAIQQALFPNVDCGIRGTTGTFDSRCSSSVYVWEAGRLFLVGFRGELTGLDVTFTATPLVAGVATASQADRITATNLLRTDGITYDTLEKLEIRLGSGDDRFNVRGTLPHTVLTTGAGDDVVYVSDAAKLEDLLTALSVAGRDLETLHEAVLHGTVTYDDLTFNGTLDEVDGKLDIDTGGGSNTLAVSDHASPNADGTTAAPFVVTSTSITGLATGVITYDSTGGDLAGQGAWTRLHDAGMFGRGITIHLGTGDDVGTIESVRGGANVDTPLQLTITTVYGNDGKDVLTVNAPDVRDGTTGELLARLVVHGGNGNDIIDGTAASLPLIVFGEDGAEDGNDTIQGGSNDDVLFGDDGRVVLYRDTDNDTAPDPDSEADSGDTDVTVNVFDVWLGGTKVDLPASVISGTSTMGAPTPVGTAYPHDAVFETLDVIYTFFVDETFRNDIIRGGAGDDVIIGGVGDDGLDGEIGRDFVLGDRAILTRNNAETSPIVRALIGEALVDVDGTTGEASLGAVDGTHRADPNGAWPWTITLLDHSTATTDDRWGDDVAAGGAGDDVVFGQLGTDLLHGDGVLVTGEDGWTIAPAAAPDTDLDPVTELKVDTDAVTGWETDGDDYVEGNGGGDTIFGGLGQDDLLGGSSDLFGLVTREQRPDGIDTIHGGNGDASGRNDDGLTAADAASRDADVILGDNGRVFRIVGTSEKATGAFLTFTHDLGCDSETETECIIPRQVELLDYTAVGESFLLAVDDPANPVWHAPIGLVNLGGGDLLHGEASNDTIWGATGEDAIFGDAGDDDLYGGTNRDWISGGTGSDGIIADHGIILTSRHGSLETLYGVNEKTTENTNDQPELSTPGDLQTAHINQAGALHKAVELDFAIVVADGTDQDDEPDLLRYTTFYVGDHDIVYGGLGDDFLHGGEGDDMLSGAEALSLYYTGDPWETLRSIYGELVGHDAGILQHGVVHEGVERDSEFRCYDEYAPMAQLYVCDALARPVTVDRDGDGHEYTSIRYLYLTNNDALEDDGQDVIFGDGGNDWIVGGVNHDRVFGGWGDDLLDMDDDKSTNSGANDTTDTSTDTSTSFADIAYGGAGRDILIANTGADRLIDWVGEYNSYVVPFSPYGAFTISRSNAPALRQYLLDLAAAEGADVTRGGQATRNGEPYGELGMVTQQDDEWGAQTGAPDDPQAGNLQGPRDVLRSENFTATADALSAFAVDSGTWSVTNDRYESTAVLGRDALSLFYVDAQLPNYFELTATVSSDKAKGGYKSNAYLVFDYQGSTDFRFAGIEIGTGKVQIGHRTGAGWQVLAQANLALVANRSYDLVVVVNGQTVTLYVDGVAQLTHTFASPLLDPDRPELGVVDPLTDGMVGVGSYSAIMRVEQMSVRKLTPEITFTQTEAFDGPSGHRVEGGSWATSGGTATGAPATTPAVTTTSLDIAPGFRLLAEAHLSTAGSAGIVFDWYAADRFKFVLLDVAGDRIIVGHYDGTWVHDAIVDVALDAGTFYDLQVVLSGTSVSVMLDGVTVLSHITFSLLSDGRVGLLVRNGSGTFDAFTLSTDDPDLTPAVPFVNVGDATVVEGDENTTTVTIDVTLSYAPTVPVTVHWQTADGSAAAGSDYDAGSGTITFDAGETTATVTLQVHTDLIEEGNETFTIVLSSPAGALLGDATGQVTILNDDVATTVAVAAIDIIATEGSTTDTAAFVVTRDGDLSGPLAVTVALQGLGVRGVDYTIAASGETLSGTTLTFADGSDSITLTVHALTDSVAEGLESVVLSIVAQAHYGIGGSGSAMVSLQDDAVLPTLSVSDAQVLEGDRGGTWATVTITLSRATATDVTVELRTYDATAKAGEDYRSYVTTLTIAAGQTSATVNLRILSDRKREGDEWFTVELANPTGAVVADSTGVITIIDDEGGRLTATATGTNGTPLDPGALAAALQDAVAWWAAQGVDVTHLTTLPVRLVDLPGRTLAIQTASGLLLDLDAAGHGWGGRSGMDLATVLRHELGHVLGLEHTVAAGHVMQALLAPGQSWTALGSGAAAVPGMPVQHVATFTTVARPVVGPEVHTATTPVTGPMAGSSSSPLVIRSGAVAGEVARVLTDSLALPTTHPVARLPEPLLAWVAMVLLALGLAGSRVPEGRGHRARHRLFT